MMNATLCILVAYFLGSIPSAYIAGRLKGVDLRRYGSGNLGFTNSWRVLGATASIPVLLFDIAKGSASVLLAYTLVPNQDLIAIGCGLVTILGHNWTIFLGFKGGGKGVATSAGVFATLLPIPFIFTLIVFLSILLTTRYMSLASMLGVMTLVSVGGIMKLMAYENAPSLEVLIFSLIVATLILIRHRTNISRLLHGTESKIGHKPKPDSTQEETES